MDCLNLLVNNLDEWPEDVKYICQDRLGFLHYFSEGCDVDFTMDCVTENDWLVECHKTMLAGELKEWPEVKRSKTLFRKVNPVIGKKYEVSYTPQMGRWWPNAEVVATDGDYIIFKREGKTKPLVRLKTDVDFREMKNAEEICIEKV